MFVLQVGLASLLPLFVGSAVTGVTNKDFRHLSIAVAAWLGISLVRILVVYFREGYEIRWIDFDLPRFFSRLSMEKYFSISMGQHHLSHSLIKQEVVSRGEASVQGVINMTLYELLPILLSVIFPLVFVLVKVPQIGVCLLGFMICFIAYTLKYTQPFIPRLKVLNKRGNDLGKKRGEIKQNVDVVISNAQEKRVVEECDGETVAYSNDSKVLWLSFLRWYNAGQGMVVSAQAATIVFAGYLVYMDKITAGLFVTIVMWAGSILGTLNNMSSLYRHFIRLLPPMERYFKFLDYEPDIVMPERPVSLTHLLGRIEFRNVDFTYRSRGATDAMIDDETPVLQRVETDSEKVATLRNVSFVLEPGKFHAIVGGSGAGKSTLVGLILRAVDPSGGQVLIDGIDLRHVDYHELRRHIGLVPQDVSLFDQSIRYNVTFGLNGSAKDVTDDELDRVAKLSRIDEFMKRLERRWDTDIGERGIKVSGGQRQRIGIARALIKNPQILILDEATSSLDTENEGLIRASVKEASVGKTTLVIAHRLATVKDADRIIVLHEGSVVGQGTHAELLATSAHYQRLVQSQVIVG